MDAEELVAINMKVGSIFSHYEAEFQIQHIGAGKVTYAATNGGKRYKMPIFDFENRAKSGRIAFESVDELMLLEEIQRKALFRRIRYCEFAVKNSNNPTSRMELKPLIPIISEVLSDPKPPHEKTYSYWVKDYINKGTTGLIVRPQRGNHSSRLDPAIESLITEGIKEHYLVREHRDSKDVYAYVIGNLLETSSFIETDKPPVSKRTVQRRIAALDPIAVIEAKQGKEAAKRASRASGKKIISQGALFVTEIDTFYANAVIIDGETGVALGRPFVICIICIHTKFIIGYHISLYSTNNTTTLAAIINAVTTHGTPTQIIGDRGKEFVNSALEALCNELVIDLKEPPARTPNAKPHVESFYKNLSYDLSNKLVGTTKSSPEELGDYDPREFAIMTMSDFEGYFVRWKDEIYHKEKHSGSGRVPLVHWEEESRKQEPMKMTMDYVSKIARRPMMITINKGNVRFQDLTYRSDALMKYNGQRLKVLIDDLDLKLVYVELPDGSTIKAKSNDEDYTSGLTYDQHMAAKKIRAQLGADDLEVVGKYAAVYSRYLLLSDLQKNRNIGVQARKRLLEGKDTKSMKDKFASAAEFTEDEAGPETNEVFENQDIESSQDTRTCDMNVGAESDQANAEATPVKKTFSTFKITTME